MNDNVNLAQVIALIKKMGGGSAGGGTSDYLDLSNKPQINGVDLSGNKELKDFGYPIFYWNGKGSDIDSDNIILWEKILNEARKQTVLIFASNEDSISKYYKSFFVLNPADTESYITGTKSITSILTGSITGGHTATYGFMSEYKGIVNIVFEEKSIVSVSDINYTTNQLMQYLSLNYDYYVPYEPKYAGSPATKKYVDDQLANIGSGDTAIFYWSGESSDTDVGAIEVWREVLSLTAQGQTCLVITELSQAKTPSSDVCIYAVKYDDFLDYQDELSNGIRALNSLPFGSSVGRNAFHKAIEVLGSSFTLTITDGEIVSVKSTAYKITSATFLGTGEEDVMYPDDETKYFVPEKNAHPVSKGYLDERLADIQPSDAKVFYWDGQGSDINADNITLWQNIIDTAKEQTVLVYTSKKDSDSERYKGIFIINGKTVETFIDGSKGISSPYSVFSSQQTAGKGYTSQIQITARISLSFADSSVVSISTINYSSTGAGNRLDPETDYSTPYTPKYAGSPVTKQYVDDQIGNIATILDSINGEEV